MRVPRSLLLRVTGVFHKMWQGHNFEHILEQRADKLAYLRDLCRTKARAAAGLVLWYSYCIMGNHT